MADVREHRQSASSAQSGEGVGRRLPPPRLNWSACGLAEWQALCSDFVDDWERGHGAYWVPVAFAVGVLGYLAVDREPMFAVVAGLAVLFWAAGLTLMNRPFWRTALIGLALVALGASAAQLQMRLAAAPVLTMPVTATVTGYLEDVTPRDGGRMRIRVAVDAFDTKWPVDRPPNKVDVSARAASDLTVGDAVRFKARLFPPQGPVLPTGYDFARARFLDRVGASGFVYGHVNRAESASPPWRIRALAMLASLRTAIAARIAASMPEEPAAIATALITGERGTIDPDIQEALRASGLAHVLAISGLHMMLVSGSMFFAVRALLAAVPDLPLIWPIKKIAAVAALCVAAFYLALSGASVATQRAFIMAAVAFLAVLIDRPAMSMHTVAVAAMVVMLIDPAAVPGPGFQMSFLAVIALVAVYRESWHRDDRGPPPDRAGVAAWLRTLPGGIARNARAIFVSSLVAGLATAPIAAFTFHRVAALGLVANLLAMPVIGTLVMPVALVYVLAMALGLEMWVAPVLSAGISWLIWVATTVHAWGGSGSIGAQSVWMPILAAAGLLMLCLIRARLRFAGIALIASGLLLSPFAQKPDLLIAEDGRTAALRTTNGSLGFLGTRISEFVASVWLRADADGRDPAGKLLADAADCDKAACRLRWRPPGDPASPQSDQDAPNKDPPFARWRPAVERFGGPDGRPPPRGPWLLPFPQEGLLIEVVARPEGLTPACKRADIVITDFRLRYPCRSALLIADGNLLQRTGMLSVSVLRREARGGGRDAKGGGAAAASGENASGWVLEISPAIRSHHRPWTRWRAASRPAGAD